MSNPFEYQGDQSPTRKGEDAENPYRPPIADEPEFTESRTGRIIAAWLIGITAVPSVMIVFFTTCFFSGLLLIDISQDSALFLVVSIPVGLASSGLTIWMFVKLIKATLGKRENLFDREAHERAQAKNDPPT